MWLSRKFTPEPWGKSVQERPGSGDCLSVSMGACGFCVSHPTMTPMWKTGDASQRELLGIYESYSNSAKKRGSFCGQF